MSFLEIFNLTHLNATLDPSIMTIRFFRGSSGIFIGFGDIFIFLGEFFICSCLRCSARSFNVFIVLARRLIL